MSMNVPTYKSVRAANLANVSRLPLAVGSPSGTIGGVKFGAAVRRGINANSNVAPAITQNAASYKTTLARLTKLAKLSRKNAAIWAGSAVGDYAADTLANMIWSHFNATSEGYDIPEGMTYDESLGLLYYNGGLKFTYSAEVTPPKWASAKFGLKSVEVPQPYWQHFYLDQFGAWQWWYTWTLPANTVPKKLVRPKTIPAGVPFSENYIFEEASPWPELMPKTRTAYRNRVPFRELPTSAKNYNSFSVGPKDKFEVGHAAARRPNKRTTEAKATGSVGKILAFMGAALDWTTETMEVLEILYDHAGIPKYHDMRTRTELYFLYGGWKRVDDWDALYMDLLKNYLTDKYIYGRFFGAVSKSARKNNLTGYNPLTHMPV